MRKVFSIVRAIVAEHLDIDAESITAQSRLESLGIDDLDLTEIAMALEDEFGTDSLVDGISLSSVQTVEDLVMAVRKSAKSAGGLDV